jgi:hypothetical protein
MKATDRTSDAASTTADNTVSAARSAISRLGPIIHITDQGAASPDPIVSTTDPRPPSALGGHAAAHSSSASGTDPAEEQH